MVRLIFSIFAQNIYIYIFFEGETLRGGLGGDGGANFSKKLKLFVEAKIWNLGKFEYVESDGDFQSFLF